MLDSTPWPLERKQFTVYPPSTRISAHVQVSSKHTDEGLLKLKEQLVDY